MATVAITDTTNTTTTILSRPTTTPTNENDPSINTLPSVEDININAISIKLPPFWPDSAEPWFIIAEAQFNLNRISSENTKYTHLLTALPADIIQNNLDLIQNPTDPARLYSNFKKNIIARLSPSEEQRISKVLYHTEIGDKRPSEFYRHLIQLVGRSDELGSRVIKKLFVDRLPKSIQRALIPLEKLPLNEQLEIADKLWEAENFNSRHLSAVSNNSNFEKDFCTKIDPSTEILKMKNEIEQIKIIMQKLIDNLGNINNNRRSRSFSNERIRDRN